MAFLEWHDSYNFGVKEIDNQHRGLFDLISRLSKTNQYEHGDKYFLATMHTLYQYADLHFQTEERYMAQAHYLKLAEHQKEHADFLNHLQTLIQDFEKNKSGMQQQILGFLRDWYMNHILGTDRDYVETLKSKGLK